MNGYIDPALRRWQNTAGDVASLETIAGQRLACPTCRAERRICELMKPAGASGWRCASGHWFGSTLLSGDNRNYFF